jgi:FtsZ-interacting cell division protein YlmF
MATFWQKTLFYLGLVDDDADGEQAATGAASSPPPAAGEQPRVVTARPPGSVAGRRVDPPAAANRQNSSWEHAEAGVYVQPGSESGRPPDAMHRPSPQTEIIVARNFSDAQMLADGIRSGRALVLDLRSTEPEMVRRLVDFTSGLTYALDGKMAKIAQGVILVSPAGVAVSSAELDRLATLGLYGSR